MWEDAMDGAASERADQALNRYVKADGRSPTSGPSSSTCAEQGLSIEGLPLRATLPLETVQAIESGTRLSTEQEFALLGRQPAAADGRSPGRDPAASGIRAFG
jgi:hypothetical protein